MDENAYKCECGKEIHAINPVQLESQVKFHKTSKKHKNFIRTQKKSEEKKQ